MAEKMRFIFSAAWLFLRPFIRLMLSRLGPVLANAAIAAVQAVAIGMAGASGKEKREAAFEAIKSDLMNQGIQVGVEVSTSMVNAAIELAYQKLKE